MANEEMQFANDPIGAVQSSTGGTGWRVLLLIGLLIASAVAWAAWATVEQVTSGQGKVIPSSQIQTVDTLEPGTVAEILVKEGDRVEAGQELIRIDDTGASSKLGELSQRQASLTAELKRLRAELSDETEFEFSQKADPVVQGFYLDQKAVFESNKRQLQEQAAVRKTQLSQKQQALEEAIASRKRTSGLLGSANKELGLIKKLFRRKAVPQIDLIRAQRESTRLSGDMKVFKATENRLLAEIEEAKALLGSERAAFMAEATSRLSRVNADLAVVTQTIRAATNTVNRRVLRSPVNGIVNKVNVAAKNQVVSSGESVVDIVPIDDRLLVETQIRPEDIAFIRAGLPATIRISAYDYTRYGTLKGTVLRIGADTITNENRETFYQVVVSTEDDKSNEQTNEKLNIIPGMVASVDIATGERTVLQYLMKPILVMKDRALRDPR